MTLFRALLACFLAVAAAHLVFLVAGQSTPASVTQILAMPILAAVVAARRNRSRPVRWTIVALAMSWLGDTVPRFLDGDAAFLAMVGGFLLAQIAYIVALRPFAATSILRLRRGWLAVYAAVFVALLAACLPSAGVLAPAVVVYGVLLVTMAVLATGLNGITWVGGALFLVSDGLIALRTFVDWWPLTGAPQGLVIMSTYFAAQLLLGLGVLRRIRDTRDTAGERAAAAV